MPEAEILHSPEILAWLLEDDNPSVRYLALKQQEILPATP